MYTRNIIILISLFYNFSFSIVSMFNLFELGYKARFNVDWSILFIIVHILIVGHILWSRKSQSLNLGDKIKLKRLSYIIALVGSFISILLFFILNHYKAFSGEYYYKLSWNSYWFLPTVLLFFSCLLTYIGYLFSILYDFAIAPIVNWVNEK